MAGSAHTVHGFDHIVVAICPALGDRLRRIRGIASAGGGRRHGRRIRRFLEQRDADIDFGHSDGRLSFRTPKAPIGYPTQKGKASLLRTSRGWRTANRWS